LIWTQRGSSVFYLTIVCVIIDIQCQRNKTLNDPSIKQMC
jgi:hypothetical protein